MSIAKRAIPDAGSIEEANQIVHGNWLNAIEEHHLKYSGNCQINDILDIGCSVGVSTRYLAEKFPSAKTVVSASQTFLTISYQCNRIHNFFQNFVFIRFRNFDLLFSLFRDCEP